MFHKYGYEDNILNYDNKYRLLKRYDKYESVQLNTQ